MKGDLSNRVAPGVGVRFENVVYNFGKVNQPGKAFLENLVYNKDVNIYLITLLNERKAKAWCYKWAIPYTQLWEVGSTLEIAEVCQAHSLVLYYDTDDRVLEAVASRGKHQTSTQKWEQPLDTRS